MKSTANSIALALFLLTAGSLAAQFNRYPTLPANADPVIAATLAEKTDGHHARYRFLTIDPQNQGHCYVDAHGLNNSGWVIVVWSDPADCNILHSSLWAQGEWSSLDFVKTQFPDLSTYLTSLNEWGVAFGTYWSYSPAFTSEPAIGLLVKTHKWFALPAIKNFPFNQGLSMSNNGLAVGGAWNSGNVFKHWIWDGDRYIFPTFPAGWDVSTFWSGPLFINDWGQIAGQYMDTASNRMRGYFQEGSKITPFDAPGNPAGTYVNRITDDGYILVDAAYNQGSAYYPSHSFTWKHGQFTALPNAPGATITYIYGLNDNGDISGVWEDSASLWHVFIAYRDE